MKSRSSSRACQSTIPCDTLRPSLVRPFASTQPPPSGPCGKRWCLPGTIVSRRTMRRIWSWPYVRLSPWPRWIPRCEPPRRSRACRCGCRSNLCCESRAGRAKRAPPPEKHKCRMTNVERITKLKARSGPICASAFVLLSSWVIRHSFTSLLRSFLLLHSPNLVGLASLDPPYRLDLVLCADSGSC
jgi:hypothetical protein